MNEGLPETLRVEKFVNLHKEFDPDEYELTRNRKLRGHSSGGLSRCDSGSGREATSAEVEAEFTYQDGRTGKIKTSTNRDSRTGGV